MRVLHLVSSLEVGGLESLVISMCSHVKKHKDIEFMICSLSDTMSVLTERAENEKVETVYFKKNINKFTILIQLLKLVKQRKINIIHTHNSKAHLFGVVAAKLSGLSVIHTKHGNYIPTNNSMEFLLNRLLCNATTKVVAVSDDTKKHLMESYALSSNKVMTILNGIDTDKFLCDKTECMKNNEITIGCVGRLNHLKGHDTAIRALEKISKNIEKVRLVIAGDGELRCHLEALAADLKIQDKVTFLGDCLNISETLKSFHLFVQPSLMEGLSLTLLEAMAASLPVITTNVGGNPEIIESMKNGILISPNNPEELAQAAIGLLNDINLRKKLGSAAKETVQRKFGIESMISRYIQLYEECLSTKNKSQ